MKINYIEQILKSNQHFIERTGKDFFSEYQDNQNPFMTLVTCSDSRLQSEAFETCAINKIFIVRNIGNQIYSNEGSVDYGVLFLKTPVLLILGHSDCGAIKTFIKGYKNEPVSIKQELDHLIPVVDKKDKALLENITSNIQYQVEVAMEKYSELVHENQLLILGGFYDFKNEYNEGYGKLKILSINAEPED